MKKAILALSAVFLLAGLLSGCGKSESVASAPAAIHVVSREDGSGTRGAFIELFGVQQKGSDGKQKDLTTKEAIIANETNVMLTNIENNKHAIGYVSMGSLSNKIKALSVDGVEPTTANVKSGAYKISRPFNIATKAGKDGLAKDFIDFILSREGQAVVAKSGYIAVSEQAAVFAGKKPGGKIVVAGSSSVTPVMEKLKEAYKALNPNATIEIQMSDSTFGMTAAIDGTCDIGMASRELKEGEKAKLSSTKIALDGIAVIVNKANPLSNIAKDDAKKIYTGGLTTWGDSKK